MNARNPLRRREDVVESWIVLAMWVVVVVGGAVAAATATRAAQDVFAQQRAHRHAVRAVLPADAPSGALSALSADGRVLATVRWTAPDGTAHTGRTTVAAGLRAGSRVLVWQDDQGRLAPAKPTGRVEGAVEAGLFGAAAALAVAAPACGAATVARACLDRRRTARWDREWDAVEPQWRHRSG
ncbi:hypothetical protein K1Y78_37100 [Streptomyces sp. tea 10]|nr:hypothetical protein [Streptomyces sp. tea 10]